MEATETRRSSLGELAGAFLKLGMISFGGPVAHLGFLRNEFVQKRRWLDDAEYSDLVALCQFLPGPASSQVVFGLGMRRAGLAGAMLASICFTMPSAVLMIAFAYGVNAMGDLSAAGWLQGLKLAALAVVAQAVWGMGKNLCPDRPRLMMCLIAAATLLIVPGALTQVSVIVAGALVGWVLYRREMAGALAGGERAPVRGHGWAAGALVVFATLLVLLPVWAASGGGAWLERFDSFYRSGSLVFGGGHVVLPLLRAEVVASGWVSDDAFLAGYGAAQAVPGPLFTFAAYLGAAMEPGKSAWMSGLWCLLAIFLPAWLLVGGALPFWHSLRSKPWAQAALRGANAVVVGILLAALYIPVMSESVKAPRDVAAALIAFGLLMSKMPPWLLVMLMAAAGQWLLKAW